MVNVWRSSAPYVSGQQFSSANIHRNTNTRRRFNCKKKPLGRTTCVPHDICLCARVCRPQVGLVVGSVHVCVSVVDKTNVPLGT